MKFGFSDPWVNPIEVDIHSHLIPGVDDGVESIEESLEIIQSFQSMGFKKCITTPHIYPDLFSNTEEKLQVEFEKVKDRVAQEEIQVEVELAAEYFLHEELFAKLKHNTSLLTFGDDYLLFETGFMNKPAFFEELMFELGTHGYRPVLAHPERYHYVGPDPEILNKLRNQRILLQVNAVSLIGAFGEVPKQIAHYMVKNGLVDFVGSDIHHSTQIEGFRRAHLNNWYKKLTKRMLINNRLL